MELATIEMIPKEAEAAFREYRQAVVAGAKEKLGDARRAYEKIDRAVMRGYRALAEGRKLLKLSETLVAGGIVEVDRNGTLVKAPALAVCRADARMCFTRGVTSRGDVRFAGDAFTPWRGEVSEAQSNIVEFSVGTFPEEMRTHGYVPQWGLKAIVPTIPPPLRPDSNLGTYHILWEAEWTGNAPVDPALLKHLGGDLWAIVAVWDLTELERAVLAGAA